MANDLFATCDRGLVIALSDLDLEAVKYSRKPLNRVSNYESKKINLNLNLNCNFNCPCLATAEQTGPIAIPYLVDNLFVAKWFSALAGN